MGNFVANPNINPNPNPNIKPNIKPIVNIKKKITTQIISNEPFEFDYKKFKIDENLQLKFKNSFNEPIDDKLIQKLRLYDKIIFGFNFNQNVKNKFPSNIISIQFGHNFNKSIDNLTIVDEIDTIQEIILSEKFNQPVNNLSPNIKKISFGFEFNNDVSNLPNKLEYIKFGYDFNSNVDYLPSSLIYVIFGNSFNQTIDNLPSSIKYIELSKDFSKQINAIPFNLEKIKFDKYYYDNNKEHLDNILVSKEFIEICF